MNRSREDRLDRMVLRAQRIVSMARLILTVLVATTVVAIGLLRSEILLVQAGLAALVATGAIGSVE